MWYNSPPFDKSYTFSSLFQNYDTNSMYTMNWMLKSMKNIDAENNLCLVRAIPLAIWGAYLKED